MFLNIKAFEKSGLQFDDLVFLCALNQKETKFLINNLADTTFKRFEALSLLTNVKSKKKDEHPYISLRLNEAGKQLLSDLEEAEILEEDSTVYEWLANYYKSAGKEIGNRKKTLSHIKDFRIKSGIERNNLIRLCTDFLKDNEERSNKLQFVFYYPKTVFATRFDLEESWLYSHYLKKEDYFKSIFETY
jgi:hypothetical protein